MVQPLLVGLDRNRNHYIAQKDSSKVSRLVRAGDAKQLRGSDGLAMAFFSLSPLAHTDGRGKCTNARAHTRAHTQQGIET